MIVKYSIIGGFGCSGSGIGDGRPFRTGLLSTIGDGELTTAGVLLQSGSWKIILNGMAGTMVKRFDLEHSKIAPTDLETAPIQVFTNPDNDEKQFLLQHFRIDEHTLHSALDPDEISRLEFEEDHAVLIYKRPRNYSSDEEFLFKVHSVGAFFFNSCLIVVSSEEIQFDGKLFHKIADLTDLILKLLYRSIYHFLEHLKVINMISGEIELKVNSSMENRFLLNMFTLEKSLVYYLNSINSNSMLIGKLRNNTSRLGFTTEHLELIDDIQIENDQCYKQAEIYSNILSGMMDARASIVSNNLNMLIKRLTVISVVFMPLNVLAGIGGMSEFSKMTNTVPWPLAYGIFTSGLIGVAFLTYWLLKLTGIDRDYVRRRRGRKSGSLG